MELAGDEVSDEGSGTYMTPTTWRIYLWTQMDGLGLGLCAAMAMVGQRRTAQR